MDDLKTGFRICSKNVGHELLDGEVVLLDNQSHRYFGMNASGTAVWLFLDAHPGATASDLTSALVEGFGVEPSQADSDLQTLLESLQFWKLVEPCEAAEAAVSVQGAQASYVAPKLEPYGELDKLILSGE